MLVVTIDGEHCKAVHVVEEAFARCRQAQEVFARHFASGHEFALGPVAHDLERGFAVHDHGCCEVPVTTGEVLINVAAHGAHLVKDRDHVVRLECVHVQLNECLAETVRAEDAQSNGLEHGRVLPCLTTVCEWDDTSRLQLGRSRVELIPCGGHIDAIGRQHFGVRPNPVNTVHVYRCRTPSALTLHVARDSLRQNFGPVVGLSNS